jgi:glucokinase
VAVFPAIDLGGTFAKGALLDPEGTILHKDRIKTKAESGYEAVVERLAKLGTALVDQARSQFTTDVPALGLAVPGIVDDAAGLAVFSANLGWRNLPLAGLLEAKLGLPVVLSHDVSASGLAEARLGAGRGAKTVLVVPIGTGIAGALIHQGHPYRGAHGAAMEIGHMRVPGFDEPCPCGGTGCLERIASAAAVARRYRELVPGAPSELDAKDVQRLAESGDIPARRVWDHARHALGQALVTLSTVLDPDRIVLAGGMALAGEALVKPVEQALQDGLIFQTPAQVVTASLGGWAGVVGAGLAAVDRVNTQAQRPAP